MATDPDDTLADQLAATLGDQDPSGRGTLARIAGVDEVGRGSWAGPLVVGAVIAGDGPAPDGIRDSKLLRPHVRGRLEREIHQWATAWSVGEVTATEIDEIGMARALTLAARRALDALPVAPDQVILDGPHDYIGAPWRVHAQAKADLTSRVVAAASIVAKEHRDRILRDLAVDHPAYALDRNAGYPSPAHRVALAQHGPVPGLHRLSWKFVDDLPGFEHMRVRAPDHRTDGGTGQLSLL